MFNLLTVTNCLIITIIQFKHVLDVLEWSWGTGCGRKMMKWIQGGEGVVVEKVEEEKRSRWWCGDFRRRYKIQGRGSAVSVQMGDFEPPWIATLTSPSIQTPCGYSLKGCSYTGLMLTKVWIVFLTISHDQNNFFLIIKSDFIYLFIVLHCLMTGCEKV